MSISKRVYDLFKAINQLDLVVYKTVNENTLNDFERMLNEAQPFNENERAQRYLLKSLYFSNPVNFMKYLCDSQNRINALILWTESKYIVKYFNLHNKVYLLWDSTTSSYKACKYLPLTQRVLNVTTQTPAVSNKKVRSVARKLDQTQQASETHQDETHQDETSQLETNQDETNQDENQQQDENQNETNQVTSHQATCQATSLKSKSWADAVN